ncbi:hypothetical protein TPY_2819 [Sulfobacillus acidophilus TPY]|uniref:Metal dependent phosphohydrolase n=1 Tax=Sulfobacillus acidophilus (strain ATCC 700253 / DSM 10332 / NAL) TaxID=679936 RepID=G8TTX3_SULAD|nr:hypothetical protein TPY_2819 [Sulfobacillus acidophilus TPY]AEW04564.1 metal dependent phosphohydrolase [Sulfobacillus acidophilus DSM 10332]
MAMTEEEKVFKDPVHGYIYVHHPVIWDLINTREMQRLRRIRQLGTTYLAYPGGDHSRFSHSLGVYEVVRQIISAFDRNGYEWPHAFDVLAMVSGLLHDVGHAPFSHALETFLGTRHERWTVRIIEDPATEVHQVLERVRPGFSREVSAVLRKDHPEKLVVSLVSSQLDADRLDYLMRDSIATGVDYGKFDLARIIRIMRPYRGRIVVRRSGIHTVEAYLLARYFMYWQVYFHPVSRAGEVLLRAILERAEAVLGQNPDPYVPHPALAQFFRRAMDVRNFLALDDSVLLTAFNLWRDHADPILKDLTRRFLDRDLFQDLPLTTRDPETLAAIREVVAEAGYDPAFYCLIDETATVYYDYYLGNQSTPKEDDQAVWLYDRDEDRLIEMSSVSRPIQAIAEESRGVRRLYVPKEIWRDPPLRARIRALSQWEEGGA